MREGEDVEEEEKTVVIIVGQRGRIKKEREIEYRREIEVYEGIEIKRRRRRTTPGRKKKGKKGKK